MLLLSFAYDHGPASPICLPKNWHVRNLPDHLMVCVGFSLHIRLWRCITCPACSDLAHMKRIFLDVVSDRFLWIFCCVGRSRCIAWWGKPQNDDNSTARRGAGASNLPTKHRRVLIQSRCTCFVTLAWVGARGNCLQAHPCGLHFERWYHDDRRYAQGVRHPWNEDSGFWLHQLIGPLDNGWAPPNCVHCCSAVSIPHGTSSF